LTWRFSQTTSIGRGFALYQCYTERGIQTAFLLENAVSSKEYPLNQELIIGYAEVDFLSTDDEPLVRSKIVGALKSKLADIAPNDIEFIKVLNKRVTNPLVADGHKWDFKHVKNLCGQGKLCVRLVENKYVKAADQDDHPK